MSSKISSSNIKISCHTSLPLVWLVTLRYFMLFAAIVKGVDSPIYSPVFLSCIYKRATDFLSNLVSCYINEGVYKLQKFLSKIYGTAYENYQIISKQ